jgi:hypothetical protein
LGNSHRKRVRHEVCGSVFLLVIEGVRHEHTFERPAVFAFGCMDLQLLCHDVHDVHQRSDYSFGGSDREGLDVGVGVGARIQRELEMRSWLWLNGNSLFYLNPGEKYMCKS